MALSKFGAAFKAARKAGKKEFSFGGKKYNTKTRDEDAPKNVPTPTANPAKAESGASRSTAGKVDKAASEKKMTERAVKRGKQGPSPAKDVGIARKGSAISRAKARQDNAPVAKEKQGPTKKRPFRGKFGTQ